MKLVGCIKLTDSALGPTIFVEVGISLFNFALGTYFICTLYSLFSPPFQWVILVFIIENIISTLVATCRYQCYKPFMFLKNATCPVTVLLAVNSLV